MSEVRAEMVANVWKVVAAEGDAVADGDTLVILESMKMEIPVLAEDSGTLTQAGRGRRRHRAGRRPDRRHRVAARAPGAHDRTHSYPGRRPWVSVRRVGDDIDQVRNA